MEIGEGAEAGVRVLKGGKVEYSGRALVRCAEGEQLFNGLTSEPTTFEGWVIDCSELTQVTTAFAIHYDDDGADDDETWVNHTTFKFANPTCEQLLRNGSSPHHAQVCGNMPLKPAMLATSGSISCRPCPSSLYSLDHGQTRPSDPSAHAKPQLISKGSLHEVKCRQCPYGASCKSGGATVRADAGFWAV